MVVKVAFIINIHWQVWIIFPLYLDARATYRVQRKKKKQTFWSYNCEILRNTIIWKSCDQSYKLAHTQVIGWALWCLWTMISLLSAYAFFLGITTPLISYKRISTRINSIRVDNSAIIPLRSISHTVQSSSFVSHSQVSTRGIAKIFFCILPIESIAFIFIVFCIN